MNFPWKLFLVSLLTQPSATLDFSDEPVVGWFIEPGMLRKVRLTIDYLDYVCTQDWKRDHVDHDHVDTLRAGAIKDHPYSH